MINRLPALSNPVRYTGLYIFDFGDHVSVGYTLEEIEYLLNESEYSQCKVYKIHRAHSDGTLEICGVSRMDWSRMGGLVLWFSQEEAARLAFDKLFELASKTPPPGRCEIILTHKRCAEYPYALIIRYVQELDEVMSNWLIELDFFAGDYSQSGTRIISQLIAGANQLGCYQLEPKEFLVSRTKEQVLADVDKLIQR